MGRPLNNPLHHPLRKLLDEIVKDTDARGLARQPSKVQELARREPHTIQPLANALEDQSEALEFNCHGYTFGLRARQRVNRRIFPDRRFITGLIAAGLLSEIDEAACSNGDIVLYLRRGLIEHSGVWSDGRVRSKWGTGHAWEHAVHEVPLRYGDEVQFYRQVQRERYDAAFADFVHTWMPGQGTA